MAEVKLINIGKVYEIDKNYVAGIDSHENVNGAPEISGSTFQA